MSNSSQNTFLYKTLEVINKQKKNTKLNNTAKKKYEEVKQSKKDRDDGEKRHLP